MSLGILQLLALAGLVLAVYGDDSTARVDELNELLSESDGEIEGVHIDGYTKERVDRTFFQPTPVTVTLPTFRPTPATATTTDETETVSPVVNPIALPPPAVPLPPGRMHICGRKGNCYQWFESDLELSIDGFKRCDSREERRAKRYCCIPEN